MREVVLALGSNLGDSAGILRGAVVDLGAIDGFDVTAVSGVFETDPVGGPAQGRYLNAVVLGRTSLGAEELLAATQDVERRWQRTREVRWGPRTLDIDILAIGTETIDMDDLTVPHPRAHERGFVLVPWLEVDPEAVIPERGAVRDLVTSVDVSGVRPTRIRLDGIGPGIGARP